MIRVLLADDQALVLGALAAVLRLEPDIDVVAEIRTGTEVLATAQRTAPDIALLDIQMPGREGLDVAADLRRALPGCRTIICTTFSRPGYLTRAMAAGAAGYVVKDSPPEQLVDAIRRVHAGLRFVDPALAAQALAGGTSPLTGREADVLRTAAEGGTVADIARALRLSPGTVRNHLSSAIGKTQARTRAEAARLAETNGWL
ncbi:response regulator [Streptomyces sp. NPDC057654]|uniref:response regulator n=1 Tax=Streptomyces sp. NPDC057654 TaxID=3346196 RepID=UPI00368BD535